LAKASALTTPGNACLRQFETVERSAVEELAVGAVQRRHRNGAGGSGSNWRSQARRAWGRDTRMLFEGERKKRFGVAAWHTYCLAAMKIRGKYSCMARRSVFPSECLKKCVCDLENLTTDLRLRLLSTTKLVISCTGHATRHAQIGRAPKRSCKGIPVPVVGRE